MPFFSRVFKPKEASSKKKLAPVANGTLPKPPQWTDAWIRTSIETHEVAELLHQCTAELKSRALDVPFLLLPFRPASDPHAARTFIRNFFGSSGNGETLRGSELVRELRMTEVPILISIMKWCWARLPGGVVTWEVYEMFKVGEKDSEYARTAFSTFIPIGAESQSRRQIIFDFFDLLAAIAAHAKSNGLGGHKLSRYAGWWAFEHLDSGKGFDIGYQSWSYAANATSHLFFAYLRSLSAGTSKSKGILSLPLSLQQLLDSTGYPPPENFLSNQATKIVMIVNLVSPTPHALLSRARTFEYRDDDRALQEFSNYDDPAKALTDECRRVLQLISSTNDSTTTVTKTSTSLLDPTWSRFEDLGFDSIEETEEEHSEVFLKRNAISPSAFSSPARTKHDDLARPTTPSWADFLSSGFVDENGQKTSAPVLLPPDKMLPPVNGTPRAMTSQSQTKPFNAEPHMEPGELASITTVEVDDAFWWVWISSLAGEELTSRKAVFGRCAVVETIIRDGRWMLMEEQVKGAALEPAPGAYVAEKKSFLGFTTKKGRLTRRRSQIKKPPVTANNNSPYGPSNFDPSSRVTLAPAQHAKIQEAAAELTRQKQLEEKAAHPPLPTSRVEEDDSQLEKKNSMLALGALVKDEGLVGLRWANQYDKREIRARYLGESVAAKESKELLTLPADGLAKTSQGPSSPLNTKEEKTLPMPPKEVAHSATPQVQTNHTVMTSSLPKAVPAPVPAQPVSSPVTHAQITVAAPPAPVLMPSPIIDNRKQSSTQQRAAVMTPVADPRPVTPESTLNNTPNEHGSSISETTMNEPPPSLKKVRRSIDGFKISPEAIRNKMKSENPTHPPPTQKNGGIRRLFSSRGSKTRGTPPRIAQDATREAEGARSPLADEPVKRAPSSNGTPLAPVSPNRMHIVTDTTTKGPIKSFEARVTTTRPQDPVNLPNDSVSPVASPAAATQEPTATPVSAIPEETTTTPVVPVEAPKPAEPTTTAPPPPVEDKEQPKNVDAPATQAPVKPAGQMPPSGPIRHEQSRSVSAAARMLEARNMAQAPKQGAPAPITLPGKPRGMAMKNLPVHGMRPPPNQPPFAPARPQGPPQGQPRVNGVVQEPFRARALSTERNQHPRVPKTRPSMENVQSQGMPVPKTHPSMENMQPQGLLVGPPRKRRDEEFDNLSRINTNDKEQAEREFSKFDQEAVAAPAEHSPVRDEFRTPPEGKSPELVPQSIYSAVTVESPVLKQAPSDMAELTPEVSAGDRWAQIRKNAAERAAKQSHEPSNPAGSLTESSEVDGDESIETRVARIKARVAELTGGIEGGRR